MLEHLEIKNFALIENLSVSFHGGFNVITGETGAGKSIILGALGLLMGEKAEASAIRNGADEITVNALISIPENHEILKWLEEKNVHPEDNAIIVKRVVKLNGRSVIYVQDQMFTRGDLTYLADSLIDMHGQSEHQSLLLADKQRKIVDAYADNSALTERTAASCRRIAELRKIKDETERQIEEARRNQDYLSFASEEIRNAEIQEGEDEQLKEKIQIISQYETIYENLSSAVQGIKDTKAMFYDVSSCLAKAAKCDSSLSDSVARLESARIEIEDIGQNLNEYISNVNYSEDAVNRMQERLSLLQKLKRKYGPNLSDVIEYGKDAEAKLEACKNSQSHLEGYEQELEEELKKYNVLSSELTKTRTDAAFILQGQIEDTLKTLGMPNVKFCINVNTEDGKISQNGKDCIEFMLSANQGENLKPLNQIASGGELSRVMLALKTVLASSDSIQTQVFDEVDSGIGGSVALSLASCINKLASHKQVIAITHLASLASKADSQFVVTKTVSDGRTYSNLSQVTGEDRVHEIARMLAGDESGVSLEHARLMLTGSGS